LKPMEEVRAELEPTVRAEKAANSLQSLANTLTTEAKTQGLDAAAAKHNLKVVTTDYVPQTAQLPGVGQSPEFMGQVFALKPNSTPEQLKTQQGFAVAQVLDSKPPRTPSFEDIRAQVEQQFRNERATEMLSKRTQELADRAKSMHDLKRAAKELGATVKTSDLVTESGNVPEVGAMSGAAQVAFSMQPGQISDAISSGRNGVVLQLVSKQEPPLSELESKKDTIREGLLQRKRGEVIQIFAEQLKAKLEKQGKIKINKQEQQRLFGKLNAAPGGPAD
jgi:peptidyl-prolyl cis-trans isomerase D